jgi:hypothetical protein
MEEEIEIPKPQFFPQPGIKAEEKPVEYYCNQLLILWDLEKNRDSLKKEFRGAKSLVAVENNNLLLVHSTGIYGVDYR